MYVNLTLYKQSRLYLLCLYAYIYNNHKNIIFINQRLSGHEFEDGGDTDRFRGNKEKEESDAIII